MRARGAKVTDIVVLVVAADDGVDAADGRGDQSREGGKVPISLRSTRSIVLTPSPSVCATSCCSTKFRWNRWAGDVLDVEVSATKKLNIDRLLETIGLQAEIFDFKANPNRAAEGTVIEAKLDRGRGPRCHRAGATRDAARRRHRRCRG